MSDFSNDEAERLKEVLAAKRIKDEKFVQERRIIQANAGSFWNATRDFAKDAVDKINDKLGRALLLWDPEHSNAIRIIAAEIGEDHNILAKFDSGAFLIKWTVPASQKRSGEMKITVHNGTLTWAYDNEHYSAQQAAEKLIKELTGTIQA